MHNFMLKTLTLAITVIAFSQLSIAAEDLSAEATSPSIAQQDLLSVYAAGRDSDPEYLAAIAGARARMETAAQARADLLPQISAFAQADRVNQRVLSTSQGAGSSAFESQSYNTLNGRIELVQPLFNWSAFAAYDAAKITRARAELSLSQAEQDLILRAAEAYFVFLAAEAELRFARTEQKAIARQLEQNQQRFDVGLIPVTDVQEAQASNDLAQAQTISAEQELANARDVLAQIIAQRVEQLPDLRDNLPLNPPEPSQPEHWVAAALDANLQHADARLAVLQAEKTLSQARGGYYPQLDVLGSTGYQDTSESSFGSEGIEHRIALRLQMPLFQGGRTRSLLSQRQQELIQAKQQLEFSRRETERLTRSSYRGVISAAKRVQALQQAVKSNQTALEANQAGFDVGLRTSVDVLNARTLLFRAKRDAAQARYDYVLQGLRLKLTAGSLNAEDLLSLNALLKQPVANKPAQSSPVVTRAEG